MVGPWFVFLGAPSRPPKKEIPGLFFPCAFPEPDEDELDMLDLAAAVKDTSRLACQMQLKHTKATEMHIVIPAECNNIW